MKRLTTIILSLVFVVATSTPVLAKNYKNRRGYHNRGHHYGWQHKQHHSRNYHRHHRHGKVYRYKGHYGSWDRWERYKRHHPNIERRGHYYHSGGHLMFGFTDDFGNSFFFSIGR